MLMRRSAAILVLTTSLSLGACSDEKKPTQAAVKAGMTRALQKQMNGSTDKNTVAKLAGCIVDGTYSKLSTRALTAIAQDQEQAKVLTHDESMMMDLATDGCANKITH